MVRLSRIFTLALAAILVTLVSGSQSVEARPFHLFGHRNHHLRPVVIAKINIREQRLNLTVDGGEVGNWPVSTAGKGYHTPRGSFRVQRMEKNWFSRRYDNSPMPNSIFFDGGIAIHGTDHVSTLGKPVSHGCVRLHPDHAKELYYLMQKYGPSRSRIIVSD